MSYQLVIDSGTTGTRSIIYDRANGNQVAFSYKEHEQIFPKSGWVEHNPVEIFENTLFTMKEALVKANLSMEDIFSVGITNQRETVVVWNKSGKPLYNAIVWQDTRTDTICAQLLKEYDNSEVNRLTGLLINTYFSGVKLKWIKDHIRNLSNEVFWGTIDSWLIYNLTGKHVIDTTNASRTLLMNIKTLEWSQDMKEILGIPDFFVFPKIIPSISFDESYGYIKHSLFNTIKEVPIKAVLGDQQAALFGNNCLKKGEIKNTYGTGCFALLNTDKLIYSKHRLLSTVAYQIEGQIAVYALEGATPVAGAAIQWLRDKLGIIHKSSESERLASRVETTGGVVFVPAFVGLYAPYWDMTARGSIFGLTRGTSREQLVRAVLEGIAWTTEDLFLALRKDAGEFNSIKVDGGMVENNLLMQIQADFSQIKIMRPKDKESTSKGIFFALEVSEGNLSVEKGFERYWYLDRVITPNISMNERDLLRKQWNKAVEKSRGWIDEKS